MFRRIIAVSSFALIVGLAAPAMAQSSYSELVGQPDSTTSPTATNVAQAPAPVRPIAGSGFEVRPGPYLRFDTGHSWATNKNVDDSWIVGGGAGWRFSPNLRADLTFDYRPDFNQTSNLGIGPGAKTGLHNWTLMLNGYYDIPIESFPLVPYVGGGIGLAHNSLHGASVAVPGTGVANFTGNDTDQFAWQLSAGVSYNFTPSLALDVGYRYLHAGETGLGGKLHANELTTSLRFGF